MIQINPFIHFNGNAEEAFNFYKSVFGGEIIKISRFKEMANEHFVVSEEEANKLMYIALSIGKNNILKGSDVPNMLGQVNENENRSKISISTESRAEAYSIFNGLSVGANIEMPITDSPWGAYFGMLRDKYGIEWMIEYVN